MLRRKNESNSPKILDVEADFQGNLLFKDEVNLHINGHFEGKLETKGELLIGERAVVRANIIGERITIAGDVKGDIHALTEIHFVSTARVVGNITTPSFTMEKGSIFHGFSQMLDDKTTDRNARALFFTVDEVANYLSVEKSLISDWAESGKLQGVKDNSGWRFDKKKVDEWIANGRIK